MTKEVNKGNSNDTINIEDEVWLFGRGELLYFQSVMKKGCCREVLQNKLLDDLHTLVRVVDLKKNTKKVSNVE